MKTIIKTQQKRNTYPGGYYLKKYLESNLTFFINKNKKTTRTFRHDYWDINDDRETLLRQQLLDYILENFNLYDVYVIFFNPTYIPYNPVNILSQMKDVRNEAIRSINKDCSFTPEEAKRLKRKVWNIHPILFELMVEFINKSELFWDEANEVIVFPRWCGI